MDLDSLKHTYQAASATPKSEAELADLSKLQHHPTLRRMRQRMVIQLGGIAGFLVLLYTGLDGHTKPWYAQAILVGSLLLYAAHELWGLRALLRPVQPAPLRQSLQQYARQLRWFGLTGWLVSTLAGGSVIFFFATTAELNATKWGFMAGMALTLPILAWLNAQLYRHQRKRLLQALSDMQE